MNFENAHRFEHYGGAGANIPRDVRPSHPEQGESGGESGPVRKLLDVCHVRLARVVSVARVDHAILREQSKELGRLRLHVLCRRRFSDVNRLPRPVGHHHDGCHWRYDLRRPVTSASDPYNLSCTSSPTTSQIAMHVQNVYFLPLKQSPLDNNAIKSALMTYGGVFTGFEWNVTAGLAPSAYYIQLQRRTTMVT